MKQINFFNMFCRNAWKFVAGDYDKLQIYTATFCIEYNIKVYAYVAEDSSSIDREGHIGVYFLEVKYEDEDVYNDPMGTCELEWLLEAFEVAEENLLNVGIPFVPSYKFRGNNKEEKEIRNNEIRKKLNIEDFEKECWEIINQKREAIKNKTEER